jgi:hypothetical protein
MDFATYGRWLWLLVNTSLSGEVELDFQIATIAVCFQLSALSSQLSTFHVHFFPGYPTGTPHV